MVLNYIWIAFFVIAFVVAVCKLLFFGDTQIFTEIINSTFDSSKTAFEISLGLTGVLSLWLGIMKIGENSGLINALSRWLSPVFCRLFPDIPKGHPVMGSIFMNMSANMLGLDNAATPMGLKAMKELQELNPKKDTASNPMIMFLVINTSGLIIIPISIMVYRAQMGAAQNGYFHPHLAKYLYLHTGRSHRCQYFPAHQSDKQSDIDTYGLPEPFLWRNHLPDSYAFTRRYGNLFHLDSQCDPVFCHHIIYRHRHSKKNQRIRFFCRRCQRRLHHSSPHHSLPGGIPRWNRGFPYFGGYGYTRWRYRLHCGILWA